MQRDPLALRSAPGSGFQNGMGLYSYVSSSPLQRTDPSGLKDDWGGWSYEPRTCDPSPSYKGHSLDIEGCDGCKKKSHEKHIVPEYMENGIGGPPLEPWMVEEDCSGFCTGSTLYLYACYIGRNEAYMRSLGNACDKIDRVCGYTESLPIIPWVEIPITVPWNWNCVDTPGP